MLAIVLAGGLGTRLRSVVSEVPKPMADVNGKPFLHYLLSHLQRDGFSRVILAVGYKRKVVQDFFGCSFKNLRIDYSIEPELRGTAVATLKAISEYSVDGPTWIINGDTFIEISYESAELNFQNDGVDIGFTITYPPDSYDRTEAFQKNIKNFDDRLLSQVGRSFNFLNCGSTFILKPDIFFSEMDSNTRGGNFEDCLTEFLNNNHSRTISLNECEFSEFIDIGTPFYYEKFQEKCRGLDFFD